MSMELLPLSFSWFEFITITLVKVDLSLLTLYKQSKYNKTTLFIHRHIYYEIKLFVLYQNMLTWLSLQIAIKTPCISIISLKRAKQNHMGDQH